MADCRHDVGPLSHSVDFKCHCYQKEPNPKDADRVSDQHAGSLV